MGKMLVLISFKFGISSYIGLKFPLRYFYNHYFLLLNVLHSKYEKTYWSCQFNCFYCFSQHWSYFCPNFGTKTTHHTLLLLSLIPMKYVRGFNDSISNLCCNPVVLKKKLVKPLKNDIFFLGGGQIFRKKQIAWVCPK